MYSFILNLILILAFGAMVYIMALALPKIDAANDVKKPKFWEKIPLDRIDRAIQKNFDKLLRRLKVFTLKADNLLSRKLNNSDDKL
ncbi:MAG: hypothetical protein KGJ01_01180 [Patescibacteria group bacterium]|nr:hypothetical protein [Patescibacteria group bacterium]